MAKISSTDVMRSEANVKLAQDFIERNKGKTVDELKVIAKNSKMSSSEKRQLLDYLEKNSTRELNKSLSYGDINNSEKLMGAIYDNTPTKQKANRKDVLALSNTKYTNTLLEKILQTQNDTAMSENILKYQQQVVSNLTLIQADIKQLVEFAKPKEVGETQAERKELEMGVSSMAKAMSNLDFREFSKEFGKGLFKQFDTDGTGELLGSMLGMFKEQIQEGSFATTIKDMIKESILDRLPMGSEIKRWRDDPVGFSQEMINRLGMSDNAGLRSLFKSHIKGMKPNLTPQIKKIDMSAAAQFDNKVHTAITRIIPEQLYKMVALLSGKEERRFDWEHQTYRNVSNMMADEYNKTATKSLTYQVDNQMRDMGANIEEIAATNKDIKNMLKFDKNGKIIKDENTGMPVLKNRGAVRQVISNIISSGCTLPDLMYGEPIIVIRQWRLDAGFSQNELGICLDAVKFLKVYYNSLPKADKESAIEDFKSAKQELNDQEVSELVQSLDEDQRMYYQSILNNKNLTEKEMKQMFKNINIRGARVDVGPLSGFFGGVGANRGSSQSLSAEEILDILRAHKDDRSSMSELNEAIVNATGRTLTDKDKDDRSKFMNKLASGTDLDRAVTASDIHDGTNEFRTYASTNREKWDRLERYLDRSTRETIDKGIGISDENSLTNIKESILHNKSLNDTQQKTFDKYLNKLNRAFSLYEAYDNAGLTANATARLLGVSPSSVKNKLRGPEDLMEFISDDGKIDVNKLKAFTASSGVDLSYITDEANERVEKDYQRSQRGSIGGGLKSSITQTLSSIFGDPKIANKAGIAVGSAAGLGIAQLLKNEGIITSPRAQYLLAAVGGGLMSMERTRRYMQNIFGPEGDIKNEQGYTNKEIFFAKAMQKYLPTIGVGGAAFKFVNKAMSSFGPLGKIVGFPLALVTAGAVGAAAPHMVRALQRSLFDRDKDDQSWMAKLGRFLKDVPFVKKYFDVTGIQSPTQIKIRSLESVKSELKAELQGLEAEPIEKLTPEKKRRMANLKDKIARIDKVQETLRKDMESGDDTQENVAKKHDELIQQTVSDINKDYFTNKDGSLNYGVVDTKVSTQNDYMSAFDRNFKRFTFDNEMREKRRNGGENPADMDYTQHFFANNGKVTAGADIVARGVASGRSQFGDQFYSASQNKVYSYDELLTADRDTQDEILSDYEKLNPNFVKAFKIYRDLKGYGVDVTDAETIGGDVRETLANKLTEFIETHDNAKQMARDVAADEQDTIQAIVGEDLFKELISLRSKAFNESERVELFKKWKSKVGDKKLQEIQELTADDAAKDGIVAQAFQIAEALVRLENEGRTGLEKLQPDQIQRRAQAMVAQVFSTDMLTKRLNSVLKDKTMNFVNKMKTFLEPGNDDSDMSKHKEAMKLFNQLDAGGKGSKSNTRVKMSELSDKKFKTGERLSIAGCSVAALNNTLYYMGITTVDVGTLITIANNHLTSNGGVSSDFFQEVGEKLGVKVTLYNNRDNKFTPESLLEVKPGGDRGLIILLKNKDGNGFHYVTARNVNTKNVTVDDPELNNSSTKMSTGDICVRAQELIMLKKVGETKALKESPLSGKLNQIKSVINTGRNLLGKVQKDGLLKTGANLLGNKVLNPLLNSTIPMTNMSIKDAIGGTGDIVRGILDGLKDMVLNIRMVDDLTLPLKMNDPEAARAVANTQGMNAKDSASKNVNQMSKKLISNKDVSNAMNETDAAEDALITLASLQNDGMVAGSSTGAGGKGSGAKANADPNAPHQSGPIANILGTIGGLVGTKGMKFLPALAKVAGIAGLGGLMYQGFKRVTKPAWSIAKDQFRRGWNNLPIFGDRQEIEYTYDEEGNVIDGQHKDVTGGLKNIRDGFNLTKVALGGIGSGTKVLEKTAKLAKSSNKVLSAVGKYSDDILKNGGTIGKILTGFGDLANKAIWAMNKIGLGKIGFMSDGAKALLDATKGKLGKWIGKILPRMAQAGAKKGAEGFLKKLPLLGSAISLAQFGWALLDGYRHSEAYTGLDPKKLDWKQKLMVGFAKALYDAGVEFLLSLANFVPGLGTALQIGWSVLRATGVVRLDDFLDMCGVSKKDLLKDIEENDRNDKAAEKKIENDIDSDTKEINKEAKQTDPEVKRMQEEYNQNVKMYGKETAKRLAQGKYGDDWENIVYPNKSSKSSNKASAKDAENILSEEFTAQSEGFRSKMYYDTEGKRTIGYGFNLDDGRFSKEQVDRWLREGISEEEAKQVLKDELAKTREKLESRAWFKKLDPVRQGAIVDMAYNMGTGGVDKFKNMISALEKGDYETAASEVLNSKYASQTGNRAVKIASLIRSGAESGESLADKANNQSLSSAKVYDSFVQKQHKDLTPDERAELEKSLAKNPSYKLWKERGKDFVHPLKNRNAMVTSAYGPRNVVGGTNPHVGIDFRGDSTTPVYSVKDGEVVTSDQSGGKIFIKHDDGTVTRYYHLSKRFPKTGDRVKAGEQIGMVGGIGASGKKAFDEHLHFETISKRGVRTDPFLELGLDPSVFKLGEGGEENEDYLKRNSWLIAQSQKEADRLAKAEASHANDKSNKPEKLGLNTEKGGPTQREKATAGEIMEKYQTGNYSKRDLKDEANRETMINLVSENSQAIKMLSAKFDQMIQLLSQIASATGQISNNSMSDFNAPSVIR